MWAAPIGRMRYTIDIGMLYVSCRGREQRKRLKGLWMCDLNLDVNDGFESLRLKPISGIRFEPWDRRPMFELICARFWMVA